MRSALLDDANLSLCKSTWVAEPQQEALEGVDHKRIHIPWIKSLDYNATLHRTCSRQRSVTLPTSRRDWDVPPRPNPQLTHWFLDVVLDYLLGSRLAPQINTSLFCARCPHSCTLRINVLVGYPSSNCSKRSMLNFEVPFVWVPR